jgi:hypothetical protein
MERMMGRRGREGRMLGWNESWKERKEKRKDKWKK